MGAARRRIGVLVALKEEMRAVAPGLRGLDAAIERTGIGRANALRRTGEFLAAIGPRALIVCGFGGGLRAGLAAGDVVIAGEVVDATAAGKRWHAPADLLGRAMAVAAASSRPFRVETGRLATVGQVLSTRADKARVRGDLGADVVDMESAGALEAAEACNLPAVCVRAVLDEHDFELPFDFGRILTPDGRPRVLEAVKAVAANPAGLRQLLPLRDRAAAASRSLGELVPRLVEALL